MTQLQEYARKPKVTEKHVQEAVVEFLRIDGWRPIRTDPVSDRSRGKGFGEIGMPDYLFLRYKREYARCGIDSTRECEHLWIEFKAPGKTRAKHQIVWHEKETARGAAVITVDCYDEFRELYVKRGLARRVH